MIIALSSRGFLSGKSEVAKAIVKNSSLQFTVEKFAEPLKVFVAQLINCTRQDLESQEFKASFLGPEWDYKEDGQIKRMTVRELLIRIGNGLRDVAHIAIWVNQKKAQYKPLPPLQYHPLEDPVLEGAYQHSKCCFCQKTYFGYKRQPYCKECAIRINEGGRFPNWIIDDWRYVLSEFEFIDEFKGKTIRIIRPSVEAIDSPSETSLDNHKFDYTIINDGTLEELEEKVKVILADLNILKK